LIYQKDNKKLGDVDAILIPGGADINPEFYLSSIPEALANYTREYYNNIKVRRI